MAYLCTPPLPNFRKITMDTNGSAVEARWATYKGGVDITLLTEAHWKSLRQRVGTEPTSLWAAALLMEFPFLKITELDQLRMEIRSASVEDGYPIGSEGLGRTMDLLAEVLE
jgi:hypothetical protein